MKALHSNEFTCPDCPREKNRKISYEGETYMVCGSCPKVVNLKRKLFTPEPQNKVTVCPVCKTTLEQIEATSLVGCPTCYEVFGENIKGLLSHN